MTQTNEEYVEKMRANFADNAAKQAAVNNRVREELDEIKRKLDAGGSAKPATERTEPVKGFKGFTKGISDAPGSAKAALVIGGVAAGMGALYGGQRAYAWKQAR